MATSAFTIGIDFGTNSVRAVVVDCADGRELGTHVFAYPSGDQGVLLDPRQPHLARQNPADYFIGLRESVSAALAEAERQSGFSRERVIGIGVDTTGSTPLPVDASARPLACDPRWKNNLAAHAWLWKDHTSAAEAGAITEIARKHAPEYLGPIGGTTVRALTGKTITTLPDYWAENHGMVHPNYTAAGVRSLLTDGEEREIGRAHV